jgi:SAM-dependent methyltransferase
MSIASAWPRDCGDTCGNVFGQSLVACDPSLKPDAQVLEIGCSEFAWLVKAKQAWPEMTFTGIDWRKCADHGVATIVQGDVMTYEPGKTFDWIASISAIEHVGLGHYAKDPSAENGDSVAMANAYRWLKPGGWMYVDVPWNVGWSYQVCGTSHRIYDDDTIASRLVQGLEWTMVSRRVYKQDGTYVDAPNRLGGNGFYYLAMWLQKAE